MAVRLGARALREARSPERSQPLAPGAAAHRPETLWERSPTATSRCRTQPAGVERDVGVGDASHNRVFWAKPRGGSSVVARNRDSRPPAKLEIAPPRIRSVGPRRRHHRLRGNRQEFRRQLGMITHPPRAAPRPRDQTAPQSREAGRTLPAPAQDRTGDAAASARRRAASIAAHGGLRRGPRRLRLGLRRRLDGKFFRRSEPHGRGLATRRRAGSPRRDFQLPWLGRTARSHGGGHRLVAQHGDASSEQPLVERRGRQVRAADPGCAPRRRGTNRKQPDGGDASNANHESTPARDSALADPSAFAGPQLPPNR